MLAVLGILKKAFYASNLRTKWYLNLAIVIKFNRCMDTQETDTKFHVLLYEKNMKKLDSVAMHSTTHLAK